jgi:hypothetical protein
VEITAETADVLARLAAPFEPKQVKFRPGATSGARALAIPYVDARVIQDRLDAVLGVVNWQDEYEFLPEGGAVLCRLRLRLGGEWITKMDVGGASEQPDEGDRRKAAVSDALKRAAVKFGVGRYLYRLPQTWVDYDPQKKQLKSLPALPQPAPAKRPAKAAASPGAALAAELAKKEAWFRRLGLCSEGDLAAAVKERTKVPDFDGLTAEGADSCLRAAEAAGRHWFGAAVEAECERTGLASLADAMAAAGIPAGRSMGTMPWEQLLKLLTALRRREAAVAV